MTNPVHQPLTALEREHRSHYWCPPAWRDKPMPTLAELALFLRGADDSHMGDLLRLMRKSDPGNRRRLAEAFPHVDRALVAWEALSPASFGELYDLMCADPVAGITRITITISEREERLLAVLVDPDQGMPTLEHVIETIIDHVQQGIYRPGAWERGWLQQAIGCYWQERLETDPDAPMMQRPIETAAAAEPAS